MALASNALILNAGSGTLKWSLFDADDQLLATATEPWCSDAAAARREQVAQLLAKVGKPSGVGHRVVHGGPWFRASVCIDDAVRDHLEALREIDPLHVDAALIGIDAIAAEYPDLIQTASFDTAFHATLPPPAAAYSLPYAWSERWQLRRYGFHGLSVAYAVWRCGELLGALPRRLIVCHLGSGCSVTAVERGVSVDTTMGFTPLEGMTMATRAGSIDPGLIIYLQRHCGVSVDELDDALNHRSGLLGLSGVSSDLRAVIAAAESGNVRAALARSHFIHDARRAVGAMYGVLGGCDALVFTGGIGEHQPGVRSGIAAALEGGGLTLDASANTATGDLDADIADPDSRIRALVIGAREDLVVLRDLRALSKG